MTSTCSTVSLVLPITDGYSFAEIHRNSSTEPPRQALLAELNDPGGEPADQCRAQGDGGSEHRWIEDRIERKVAELFHTFIVNELRARFDEVSGRFDGGVVPTSSQTPVRRRARHVVIHPHPFGHGRKA